MTIDYTIEFFSYWHCGSGLAAGADVDALAIKDEDDLPYVPGRTVKGLLHDAAVTLSGLGALKNENFIADVFGKSGDEEGHGQRSLASFGNASITGPVRKSILERKLVGGLYASVASTAIDDDGIAKDHTLRKIQVIVPCAVRGKIFGVPDTYEDDLRLCMAMVKRMGTGRSRGLGRCEIRVGD